MIDADANRDRTADELEADLNHAVGNGNRMIRESTEHVPVPSGHAPRLETHAITGYYGIMVGERDSGLDSGAWIHAENPVEVDR